MPTYTYECKLCLLEFEVTQKITEKPLEHHLSPDGFVCGPTVRLIVPGGSFNFKGAAQLPRLTDE